MLRHCIGVTLDGEMLVGGWVKPILQSLSHWLRWPCRIGGLIVVTLTALFLKIWTLVASKMAVQLWSHNWPTESKDPEARWSNPWALVAVAGRVDIGSCAVHFDRM